MGVIHAILDDARREYLYVGKTWWLPQAVDEGRVGERAFVQRCIEKNDHHSWAEVHEWIIPVAVIAWRFCERAEWKIRTVNDSGDDYPDDKEWTEWTPGTFLFALLRGDDKPTKLFEYED